MSNHQPPSVPIIGPPTGPVPTDKKDQVAERENYFRYLMESKYPELKPTGAGMKSEEARKRGAPIVERAQSSSQTNAPIDPNKLSIAPDTQTSIDKDPSVRELNRVAEQMVHHQIGYVIQMAHKKRSPKSDVPWFRIIGCETLTTINSDEPWAQFLCRNLLKVNDQNLTVFRFGRGQPFMVCVDERYQYDQVTDRRIKRLLGLYETEFNDHRAKFLQHRKTGLTKEEHETRSSFFAREVTWREAKQRHDKREAEMKKDTTDIVPPKQKAQVPNDPNKVSLRNHIFPNELKQAEYKFAVISYFRDRLAFERCFHDLSVSLEEADFQPILIVWALTETREDANSFCDLTQCNHAFLQKNLSIVDTYQWIPLDHVNTNDIPRQYANKYCNDIMSYQQTKNRALEEYHAWERERYGEELPFTNDPIVQSVEARE